MATPNYELLLYVLGQIKKVNKAEESLREAMLHFGDKDFNRVSLDKIETSYIHILELLFEDKDEWISYFIYECELGSKPREITLPDGEVMLFRSVKQLYDLLTPKK